MKSYTIAKASGAPDRDAIEPLRVGCVLWEPDCGVRMEQKLCYDDTALYVFQRAWESDIRAECSAPLSPVHEDSCMEFFFSLTDDGRYVNFEINPNACMELGFGPNRRERVRLCHKSERETFRPVCTRTPDGWTAEYRIPLSFLRILYPEFSLRSGVFFRANCYKCGDKTVHPHFLAWNAVETAAPDFHRPEFFGKMILAKKSFGASAPEDFFGLLCKVHQGKERLLRRKRYERRIKKQEFAQMLS